MHDTALQSFDAAQTAAAPMRRGGHPGGVGLRVENRSLLLTRMGMPVLKAGEFFILQDGGRFLSKIDDGRTRWSVRSAGAATRAHALVLERRGRKDSVSCCSSQQSMAETTIHRELSAPAYYVVRLFVTLLHANGVRICVLESVKSTCTLPNPGPLGSHPHSNNHRPGPTSQTARTARPSLRYMNPGTSYSVCSVARSL